ncbi:MAG TPA: YhdP family protein [Candidatus Methylomirabilis sp.]|nr:YhdP family protein [Candidatus Methylomirabilis sp.]
MKKRLRRYAVHVGRFTLRVSRWSLYVSAVVLALLAVLFTVTSFLLPRLAQQKSDLEEYLSRRSGHQVRIESLHAYWDGLHPGALASGLEVYSDNEVQPSIRLHEVRISLALTPLLLGKFEINSLVVVKPSLAVERLEDGRFRVSGFDPMRAAESGGGEKFIAWLFQQGRLVIENGELQWFDRRDTTATKAMHLSRVNLSLQNNGDRHRLDFSAEFPPEVCRDCSVTLDVKGNPFASPDWDGDIYLRASQVDVTTLPLVAREKLPPDFRGRFAAQIWSDWEQGRPVSVNGHVQAAGLQLPLPGWKLPVAIRLASGDLSWQTRGDGWRLDVANPVIGLTGKTWVAGHVRVVHQPDESRIQVKHLDLGEISAFAARTYTDRPADVAPAVAKSHPLLDYWLAGKPGGTIDNFKLRILGDWAAPEDFFLDADIAAGTVLPYEKYPGIQGLNGHLSLSRLRGSLQLDSTNVSVSFPQIFGAPLAAKRASGGIRWEKFADYWLVNGDDLQVIGDDGRGTGKLSVRVPLDPSISPYLKLRVDFKDGNGANAARYYPVRRLSPATLAWMKSSFVAGKITQGYLLYDGPVRDFPFRNGTGKFELHGHVSDAVYRFLPGWEPVRKGEVDVAVNNTDFVITGDGKIGKLSANQIVVQSHTSGEGEDVVRVTGRVAGALGETLDLLRDVKPGSGTASWFTYVPSGLTGTGDGVLSLDLTISLAQPHSVQVNGEYRFLKNNLLFPGTGVAAEGIEGFVNFTRDGVRDGRLHARVLGGDTVLSASQDRDRLLIRGDGAITAPGLAPIVGPRIAPVLSGAARWNATWHADKVVGILSAEVDLHGLKVALPPPLDRPEGLADEKLIVRTEAAARDGFRVLLNVGSRASGQLAFSRADDGWHFAGGRVGFGEARVATSVERGLQVSARVERLDLDQWFPLLGGGPSGTPDFLTRVSAEVKSFEMFDRQFGSLALDFTHDRDLWSGTLNGASVAGNARFSGRGRTANIDLDLARLVLPRKQRDRAGEPVDPRRLPTVTLRSKNFVFQDKPMGELDFMAVPGEDGWAIQRFNMTRPEMKMSVIGSWRLVNNQQMSDFNLEFNSTDLGKTMEAFGVPDQVAGGDVNIKSHLSWPGAPADPRLAVLSGKVEVSAKKGRFLQVKQGAGRLFGLLDLSAIGRYLRLDFSPVFGKGFIYDQIHGNVNVEQGNAYTRNFSLEGPAMQIDLSGRVGLAAEDYDMSIELQPKISDAVTIATWGVWGPQVAAAVLAVQKIFKKQIAEGTRITYMVKGPWQNPVITKLVKSRTLKATVVPVPADE